jgi:hypothetical protein
MVSEATLDNVARLLRLTTGISGLAIMIMGIVSMIASIGMLSLSSTIVGFYTAYVDTIMAGVCKSYALSRPRTD